MSVIAKLRLNPLSVVQSGGLRTGPKSGSFSGVQQGGNCQISESDAGGGITDLEAKSGAGTDYFFPWLQRSFTWVKVPKNAPNGTIVMTGGVNGCSLIVSELGTDYYFYHDGDSKYLPIGHASIKGTEVVRIKPSDYDPGDSTNKIFQGLLKSNQKAGIAFSGDLSYGTYVVFVKVGGQYTVVSSPIISVNGLMHLKGAQVTQF
ncbi:MAG: hypothetical protein AAGD13_01400 [Pseudomonadota bacterium]